MKERGELHAAIEARRERGELHAAIEARRELGDDYEPQLVDQFLERIEKRLEERIRDEPAHPHYPEARPT